MDIIRALHRLKYDKERKRFSSDTFKNLNGGISVIDSECVHRTTGDACLHLERFYSSVIECKPFAYWIISTDELERAFGGNFVIVEETSSTGDECHRNIVGLKDGPAQKWAKKNCRPPSVFLCARDHSIQLSNEQFERLYEFLEAMYG
jgi:hypothetical protein